MVVLILGIVIVLIFKRELESLIQRTQRIQARGVGLEMTPPQPQVPARTEGLTSPPATREPDQLPPAPPDVAATADVEAESRFVRACDLLRSGKYADGIKLMEEEARTKPVAQQVALLAFGRHLAAVKGSKAALDDLRRTAQEHQGIFEAQLWLGIALEDLGMREDACAEFLQAYGAAVSDEDRASALIWRARSRGRAQCETITVVAELLERSRTLKEHEAQSRIYASAAELFLNSDPPDFDRAFALYELAVQLAPTNNSLRFDLAYAYGQQDAHAAAFLQYKNLVDREPDNGMAANNLGAAATSLGLPSIGVDYYKRAEDLGNTLATANLAWKLINMGFLQEARARLRPKLDISGVHRNVLEALGGLARTESEDETKSKDILKAVEKIRAFRARLGEGLASGVVAGPEAGGDYSDGVAFLRVAVSPPKAVKGDLRTGGEIWDLSGSVLGPALLVQWEEREREGEKAWVYSLVPRKKGHGLFIVEGESLAGFTYEGPHSADPSMAPELKEWDFRRQTRGSG
jgi:tetratricopeptide (TPR) repeat protein